MSEFSMDEFEAIAALAPPPPVAIPPTPAEIEAATVRAELQRKEQKKREEERAYKAWHAAYPTATGIGAMFLHKDLHDLEQVTDEQRLAVKACWEFADTWRQRRADGQHSSLWFLGEIGTGKTRVASALVTTLYIDDGVSARIVETRDLITRIRDTWHGGRRVEHQADVLRELTELEVLVLDDVGADTSGTDNEKQLLFDVINGRYKAGLPTLLTSNRDPLGLREVLGERSYSRLKHGMRVLPLTEKKYREPAAVSPDKQEPNACVRETRSTS